MNRPPDGWQSPSGERYEPARLREAARRLDAWLADHNPVGAAALQPGIDATVVAVRANEEGCSLPQEVIDLLAWHDGMRVDTDVPLIWYHRYLSLSESFERRGTYGNPVLGGLLSVLRDWFPILEFQGEFYFTRCQSDRPEAPIWHWSLEEREPRLVFASLTAMLETAAEWYERGAVWAVDPETGALAEDIRQVFEIYAQRNPGGTFPYYVP